MAIGEITSMAPRIGCGDENERENAKAETILTSRLIRGRCIISTESFHHSMESFK